MSSSGTVQNVTSRGCSRAFLICSLYRMSLYISELYNKFQCRINFSIISNADINVWFAEAGNDCLSDSSFEALLGGTKYDPKDMSTFMTSPEQLKTWWKNNIERVSKRKSLIDDGKYVGNVETKNRRMIFCKLALAISMKTKEYFNNKKHPFQLATFEEAVQSLPIRCRLHVPTISFESITISPATTSQSISYVGETSTESTPVSSRNKRVRVSKKLHLNTIANADDDGHLYKACKLDMSLLFDCTANESDGSTSASSSDSSTSAVACHDRRKTSCAISSSESYQSFIRYDLGEEDNDKNDEYLLSLCSKYDSSKSNRTNATPSTVTDSMCAVSDDGIDIDDADNTSDTNSTSSNYRPTEIHRRRSFYLHNNHHYMPQHHMTKYDNDSSFLFQPITDDPYLSYTPFNFDYVDDEPELVGIHWDTSFEDVFFPCKLVNH